MPGCSFFFGGGGIEDWCGLGVTSEDGGLGGGKGIVHLVVYVFRLNTITLRLDQVVRSSRVDVRMTLRVSGSSDEAAWIIAWTKLARAESCW